jgi:hypothetical protein
MNNTFYGIPFFGIFVGPAPSMSSAQIGDIIIENNIFKNVNEKSANGSAAILLGGKGDGTIKYGSHGSGANIIVDYNMIYADSGFKTNCSYNGKSYAYINFKMVSGTQTNGVAADPILNDDLSEKPNSPTVASGISEIIYFRDDINGSPRPENGGWDIGAFQIGRNLFDALAKLGGVAFWEQFKVSLRLKGSKKMDDRHGMLLGQ